MKKTLLSLLCSGLFLAGNSAYAQRYLTEVFPVVQVTSDIIYGNNISVLTGSPAPQDLKMDVYEPFGDTETARPMIIFLHTGSFLPFPLNGTPTGTRTDSTVVEMCKQFARRGYVAVAMSYRLGWNPASGDQDVRTGTLLNAVYRAIHDAKTCVRYFRKEAAVNGNPFKIDLSRIIVGGQGSGGYVAFAYASLDKVSEIQLSKFINFNTAPPTPYINQALSGNFEGTDATPLNTPNHVGYSSSIDMVFNLGGAMGDSIWLEAGDVPMVAFHVPSDPFAPYDYGAVIVPTNGNFVVNVTGSYGTIRRANMLGNNVSLENPLAPYTDVYSVRANSINDGHKGLFPLYLPGPQAGPWEWWDPSNPNHNAGLMTNPNMSKAKGIAYIDSIQGYLAPRMVQVTKLPGYITTGISTVSNHVEVGTYPNPSREEVTFRSVSASNMIRIIEVRDMTGRIVYSNNNVGADRITVPVTEFSNGIYVARIVSDNSEQSTKLIKQ